MEGRKAAYRTLLLVIFRRDLGRVSISELGCNSELRGAQLPSGVGCTREEDTRVLLRPVVVHVIHRSLGEGHRGGDAFKPQLPIVP